MNNSEWENPDFPFAVTEEEDGSLTFHWDEHHPVTCVFNDWTEDDFINMLSDSAQQIINQAETDQ